MAHVPKGSHSFTCTPCIHPLSGMNHTCLCVFSHAIFLSTLNDLRSFVRGYTVANNLLLITRGPVYLYMSVRMSVRRQLSKALT